MKYTLSDWHLDDRTFFYKDQAYVPTHLHHHILTLHHPTTGHPGWFKTEELVKHDYWWPGMGTFIWKYVEGCTLCQQMKSDTHPSTPPLTLILSSMTCPFLQVCRFDHWFTWIQRFDSVMVLVDHGLMKGVILSPCKKTITSEGITQLFLRKISWDLVSITKLSLTEVPSSPPNSPKNLEDSLTMKSLWQSH
jgi:hypothetical protein